MKIKDKFVQIENSVIFNVNIPNSIFRTYMVLKTFKYGEGKVFPSQATLANLRGLSTRSIIYHLQVLKTLNLISYKKRGYSTSNEYFFIGDENFTNDLNDSEEITTSIMQNNSDQIFENLHSNNNKINNTEKNNIDEDFQKQTNKSGMQKILKKNPWIKGNKISNKK